MTTEPDSDTLQPKLVRFARIHLLTQIEQVTPEFFKGWLRTEIESLDGKTPLAHIMNGEAEVVAQLVENRVTDQPG